MVANQVAWNILEIIPILDSIGEHKKAAKYITICDHLKKTINEQYWDGDWYIRATDDDGNLIGTKTNEEGKIHINGQTWPVMSHIAQRERGIKAMDSLWELFDDKIWCFNIYTSLYKKKRLSRCCFSVCSRS